ncbi:lipopolysaccharide biosynthesis protein [Blastococcus sp. SYSU D01042]
MAGLPRLVAGTTVASTSAVMLAGVSMLLFARTLGPAGSGTIAVAVSVSALASLVAGLGTGVALRLLSRGLADRTLVAGYLGFSCLAAVVVAGAAGAATALLGVVGWRESILVAAYAAALCSAQQFGDLLNNLGRTVSSAGGLALGAAAQASGAGVLFLQGSGTVAAALAVMVVGSGAQCGYYVWRLAGLGELTRPAWDGTLMRRLVRTGYPALGSSLGVLGAQRFDRVVLAPIAGLEAAGIYAVAASVAELCRLILGSTGPVLFFRVSRHGWDGAAKRLYAFAAICLPAAGTVLALGAPVLIPLAFGDSFRTAADVVLLLLVAEIFMGIALLEVRVLLALEQTHFVGQVGVILLVAATVGYGLGAHWGGASGTAIASILTYAAFAASLLLRRMRVTRRILSPVQPARGGRVVLSTEREAADA